MNPQPVAFTQEGKKDAVNTILLRVENKENANLLSNFLSNFYHVVIPELGEQNTLESDFDLCLIDAITFKGLSRRITGRKDRDKSKFLPFILITSHEELKIYTPELGKNVDEIIITPVEKVELQTRIENLLRIRSLNKELEETSKKLAVTLESIPDGVVATDARGRVILLNSAATTIMERSQQECVGKNLVDLLPLEMEQTGSSIPLPVDRLLTKGGSVKRSTYTVLVTKNGDRRNINLRMDSMQGSNGDIIGIVASFRDQTLQKHLEDQVIKTGRADLLGDVVSAKLKITLPRENWIASASAAFPDVIFEILSLLPAEATEEERMKGKLIQNALVRIASIEWPKILDLMRAHPSTLALHVWEKSPEKISFAIKSIDVILLKTLIQAECILKYPVLVKNGQGTWNLIAPRIKIDRLLELFDEMGILYFLGSIEGYDVPVNRLVLTKRQQEVMETALGYGYYEIPRRITLTELSQKLNLAKSTLSNILRRISKNLVAEPNLEKK